MPRSGDTTARGYGHQHQQERKQWKPKVDAGLVYCARPDCGRLIVPGTPWDLGHSDDRTRWTGPEHRLCNRRAGGKKRQRLARSKGTSRTWS